jgi:flagellar basal-body rod protein FlgB
MIHMAVAGLNVLGFLKTKMMWHQDRQRVLAENIANADTPGYRAHDLRELKFSPSEVHRPHPVQLVATAAGHQGSLPGTASADEDRAHTFETTPEGNSVVLEEEVMKVGQNAMDHQTVAQLYTRSLGLLRKAIARPA